MAATVVDDAPIAETSTTCDGGTSMVQGGTDGGVFLPIGGNWERQWGPKVQAALVMLGLLYCFAGVANIADVFMAAIEKITSKKVRIEDRYTGKMRTVRVWNPTVANLTLMALGSSAPEILLSVIELVSNNMHAGDLGPSTIVGSAAFNLLVIIAICVVVIPSGETRSIKEMPVFIVTAIFSVFAYVWLILILCLWSPNVVEWWEGLLTFMFFPVLCILAYLADIGFIHRLFRIPMDSRTQGLVLSEDSTEEDKNLMVMIIRQKYGDSQAVANHMEDLLHYEFDPKPSRATNRIQATRAILYGKSQTYSQVSAYEYDHELTHNLLEERRKSVMHQPQSLVEFACSNYAVAEAEKVVELKLRRTGNLSKSAVVHLKTEDVTANAGEDFDRVDENISFLPGEAEKKFRINIKEDDKQEDDEEFKVRLSVRENTSVVGIGRKSVASVVIFDSDQPGVFRFREEQVNFQESPENTKVSVDILREKGTHGEVSISYRTEDDTATADFDYVPASGTLTFANGEAEKHLDLEILPRGRFKTEAFESFRLILEDATGGARFNASTDGKEESCILTVILKGDPLQSQFNRQGSFFLTPTISASQAAANRQNWWDQFVEAIHVGGSVEEQQQAGIWSWCCHIILLPWKLLCAMVPPPSVCDGAVAFFIALVIIGVLTALIGDLANMLGCALDMEPSITAITIVAIGTSLPDTFASMTSAVQDPTADNSIGNVTGSNSVNVFLGLGMPWGIGSIYWYFKGVDLTDEDDPWVKRGHEAGWWDELPEIRQQWPATFVVPAGTLGISVLVFSACATLCLLTLVARRYCLGAELGGPEVAKYITAVFFVLLWVAYVGISIVVASRG